VTVFELNCDGELSHVAQPLQEPSEQLRPLPISAVALGKAPSRADSIPTGSDILLDALREEEVAAQAQQFLETDDGQAMLRGQGQAIGSQT